MRHFVLAAITALFCSLPASAQELIPVEAFSQIPDMEHAVLSPDGNKIAYTASYEEHSILVVQNLDGAAVQAINIDALRAEGLRWADDNILLLQASDTDNYFRVQGVVDISAVIAFRLDRNLRSRQLLHRSRLGVNFNMGHIVGIEPQTGHVLIPVFDQDDSLDLLAVNPVSGRTRIAGSGRPSTRDWVVDRSGNPVVRLDYSNRHDREILRVRDGGSWRIISDEREVDRPSFTMHGLLPDGRLAVSTTIIYADRDSRRSLYAISLETGEMDDVIFSHDVYDFSHAIIDPYSSLVLGAARQNNMLEVEWFDEEMANHQRTLDAALSGKNPRVTSWSRDRKKLLIVTENEDTPPIYYLYDVENRLVDFVGTSYEALSFGELVPRNMISYTATDGTKIEAYLTLPEGEGPFPSVLLPHGGPRSRDVGGFNYFAHFLASRGYAVLQPNFRGSSGYGYNWREAGYGSWGRGVIQTDVADGAQHLIETGLADPERICIVGASYGGYSALAGATFTPDLFACSAAIAPVTALPDMMRYTWQRYGRRHWFMDYWREQFTGEPDNRNTEILRDLSPINHVEDVTIPILLIHGKDDSVVPIDQSRDMYRALRRVDADVEFVEMDEGDHWLSSVDMRTTVLTELEQFLEEHIGD